MDISKSGFWAMILCWLSAIGGIAMAILWAASKHRQPLDRELLARSLERLLKAGEISQAEYEKRLEDLRKEQASRPNPVSRRKSPPRP
jgi:putative membrane protein